MRGLDGKTVIVTGGGGGIGGPTSLRFAQEGARVVVMDVNAVGAQETAQTIQASGGQAIVSALDLTNAEDTAVEIARVERDFGEIDILVNGVGWDVFTPFLKSGPNFWTKIIDINLRSVLNVTHPVLSSMAARRSGKIVSLASDAARGGSSGESVYAACKAGIIAFSKTLAREHARHGISVNVVCPGVTETAMLEAFMEEAGDKEKLRHAFARAVPMGRLGQPEDLPGAIVFFASEDANFITGQVLSVSGGLTMQG